jgi:hypothetical protein
MSNMPVPLRTRVAEFASQSEELTSCVEEGCMRASPKAEVFSEKPPHRTVTLSNGQHKFQFISDVSVYEGPVKTRSCSTYRALIKW